MSAKSVNPGVNPQPSSCSSRKTKSVGYRPYMKGKKKVLGIYIRHEHECPAYLPEDKGKTCRCTPYFKPRYQGTFGATFRDEASALTALGVMRKGTGSVGAREAEGWTFGKGADVWLEGVESGSIQRRRRGRAEPYSESTLPDYRRIVAFLKSEEVGFEDRLAKEITDSDWWDVFQDLNTGARGLSGNPQSYSRRASIKSVASNIYSYMAQRPLQGRTGVTSNPLLLIDLGANDGVARERVALPEEARDILAALGSLDRVPYAIAFYGGPRRQDIDRVEWTDLDFITTDAGHRVPGHWLRIRPLDNPRRGPGKVGDGRWIPLAPQLRAVVLEEWQRQGRPTTGKIVLRAVTSWRLYERADAALELANKERAKVFGRPLRPRQKHEAWGPEHLLEPIRLHEGRHTYCSWLVRSKKWDIYTMQKFMGQKQMSTFQRYVHTVMEHGPREDLGEVDVFGDQAQPG